MKFFSKPLMAVLAAALFTSGAQAVVLTFDDLASPGTTSGFFTAPYNGFSFGNLDAATNDWFWRSDNPSPPYPAQSGTTTVSTDATLYDPSNFFEESTRVTAGFDFVLDGAWFSGPGSNSDGSAAQVQLRMYRDGTLVASSGLLGLNPSAPLFLNSGYTGLIDAFSVVGAQGYWVMDSVTLGTAVPEPATAALVALALVGAGASMRRRAVSSAHGRGRRG